MYVHALNRYEAPIRGLRARAYIQQGQIYRSCGVQECRGTSNARAKDLIMPSLGTIPQILQLQCTKLKWKLPCESQGPSPRNGPTIEHVSTRTKLSRELSINGVSRPARAKTEPEQGLHARVQDPHRGRSPR